MEQLPTPGKIVSEVQIAGVGITEWRLSNGVRVLLKPTDFNPDEILVSGYGWGGMSLVPDADLTSAQLANVLPSTSGLGAHSTAALQTAIAGKLLSVGMRIDPFSQTVEGGASVRDLESLLQLVYLHFTAPRVDTPAVRAWQQRVRSSLEARSGATELHLGDTVAALLTQGHPRARPLTAAQVDSIDLGRALTIYRERFGDAGGFTFVLVGKLHADSLRPLVTRYLGSLPSSGDSERGWRDHGIRAPSGVVERTFNSGVENRSRTVIIFHGPFTDRVDEQPSLSAMGSVLQHRLRERLREQLGATYSVSVQTVAQSLPDLNYQVSIGFDAAPERIDELTSAVFAEVESLRELGPTTEEVRRVREESLRELELAQRSNGYWMRMVVTYSMMERPLGEIASYAEHFRELNAERVHAMARKYLDTWRYVRVTQMPGR